MNVILIDSHHDRQDFDCGDLQLNDFLRTKARKHTKSYTGRTFVLVDTPVSDKILGFYTISSGNISCTSVPANVPKHPIPVAHLGRLAIDKKHQKKGMGEYLLMDALYRVRRIKDDMAIYAVEVVAKHEKAKAFYLRYGFSELLDNDHHLYLPMNIIMKLP